MDAINGNTQSESVGQRSSPGLRDSALFRIIFVQLHILAGAGCTKRFERQSEVKGGI